MSSTDTGVSVYTPMQVSTAQTYYLWKTLVPLRISVTTMPSVFSPLRVVQTTSVSVHLGTQVSAEQCSL